MYYEYITCTDAVPKKVFYLILQGKYFYWDDNDYNDFLKKLNVSKYFNYQKSKILILKDLVDKNFYNSNHKF